MALETVYKTTPTEDIISILAQLHQEIAKSGPLTDAAKKQFWEEIKDFHSRIVDEDLGHLSSNHQIMEKVLFLMGEVDPDNIDVEYKYKLGCRYLTDQMPMSPNRVRAAEYLYYAACKDHPGAKEIMVSSLGKELLEHVMNEVKNGITKVAFDSPYNKCSAKQQKLINGSLTTLDEQGRLKCIMFTRELREDFITQQTAVVMAHKDKEQHAQPPNSSITMPSIGAIKESYIRLD